MGKGLSIRQKVKEKKKKKKNWRKGGIALYEQFLLFLQCFHISLQFKLSIVSVKNHSPVCYQLWKFLSTKFTICFSSQGVRQRLSPGQGHSTLPVFTREVCTQPEPFCYEAGDLFEGNQHSL